MSAKRHNSIGEPGAVGRALRAHRGGQRTARPTIPGGLKPNRMRGDSGFSLIEVMCAILVMGVALVALTHGMTTALASTKDSEVQTTIVSLAAGQIETLRAGGVLTDDTTEGDFGESFPRYKWEQTVAPSDVDGLHQVDVLVKDAKSDATLYKLTTLLFDTDYPSSSAADAKQKQREQDKAKKRNRRGA